MAGADGFSLSWAADLPASFFGEEGAGSGLIVAFDTFNNGAAEAPAIDVKWNGAIIAHSAVPFNFSAANAAFVPVTVNLGTGGTVMVTFNNVLVHSGVVLPGFTPLAGAKFGFGARTGGLNERHYLDDVAITTTTFIGVVDDFAVNQATINGPGSSTQDGAASSIAGGERDVQAAVSSGTITAGVRLGALAITGDAGASGTVTVSWDGDDNDATTLANTGLGGVNLSAGGDAFLLGLNSLNGSPTLTLTVHSGASSSSVLLPGLVPSSVPQLVRVPFSSFAGTANFTSVGAIQLQVDALAGASVAVDYLRIGSATTPAIEALLTDVVLVDNDGNGKASAGDTLRYTLRMANNTGGTLNNVQLNVPAIPNTSAPANLTASPLARDEGPAPNSLPGSAFHANFNTPLTVSDGDADEDLLNNDFLGAPAATITRFGGGSLGGTVDSNNAGATASSGGHSLTVNANGSFTLTPASGFAGLLTFQYRLANTSGSDTATVTVAVGERPNALADLRNVTGNVQIDTSTGVAFSVLGNDDGDGVTINLNTAGTLGAVSMGASGQFVYTPPRGKSSGTDTFSYTLSNGFGTSGSATVTLNFANIVWFIDASVGAGDGRSHTPYNTLAAFNAANNGAASNPADNHVIVLRDGTYVNNVAGGALVLRNGQRVIGDGWSGTFLAAAGFSLAAHSVVAAFSGTDPVIQNSTEHGIALMSGNQLFGLTAGNMPNGFGYSGTAVGSLVVAECSKTGTGGAVGITTSGAFGSSVNFDTLESTSSTGASLNLTGITGTLGINSGGAGLVGSAAGSAAVSISGGSLTMTYPGNITKANAGALVSVTGGHTGTLTFQTGTLSATGGTGLQFDNADGIYNFSGAITLNGGDAGIDIVNGSGGNFTFNNANITNPSGAAFVVNGGAGSIGHTGTITKNNAGRLVDIQGRAGGSVTLAGNLSSTATATGILCQNNTGGTLTFSGASKVINTGANPAVTLANNTGATINFTGGGLALTTTTGAGFSATGGGTVSVVGAGNTIASGSGAGLTVANTTISASGLTFVSVSSSGGSVPGIFLDTTGVLGGLTVTGDGVNTTRGGNSSGGALGGKTDLDGTPDGGGNDGLGIIGTAVYLNNTRNITLRRVTVTGANENFGIYAENVTGLVMEYCTVGGANGDAFTTAVGHGEGTFIINNLLGTANSVNECVVSGGFEDNFRIENTSATAMTLSLANSTIQNNNTTSGRLGFRFATATPGVTMTGLVTDCIFQGNRTEAINSDASNGNVDVTITNNTIIAGTAGNNQGNLGININCANSGVMTSTIVNNRVGTDGVTPRPLRNTGINLRAGGTAACTLVSKIANNTVVNGGAGRSGHGIRAFQETSSVMRMNISNNTVSNVGFDNGITVSANGSGIGPSTGRVEVWVVGNNSSVLGTALNPIRLLARRDTVMIARVFSNTTSAGGSGRGALHCSQANTAQFRIEDDADALAPELALGNVLGSAVQTFLTGKNPGVPSFEILPVIDPGGFIGVAAGTAIVPQ